jgi:putative ABC transport system ATP-binding protein
MKTLFIGPISAFHPEETSPHMTKAVRFENVSLTLKAQAGPVEILKGVSFALGQGEAIGIIGPSGSGKTSLLMVASGLEAATTGKVEVAGVGLNGKSEAALAQFRRDTIGIIFQSFHLIPTMTALENVAVPLEFKGRADAMGQAEAGLERVGLGHRLTHYPSQLSGGEQQRVAIARAVTAGAKILLADEPTGNLDQETGAAIIDLLFELKEKDGATLLLVTHDRQLAKRCSRILEVRDGQVGEGRV